MAKAFISSAGSAGSSDPRLSQPKKLSSLLSSIAEWLSLAAVILVPLVFMTSTSQALEFPKQIVLLALVSLAALAWVGSMLINRGVGLRRTVANPVVLVLLAATLVSALASSAKYVSIVGDGGQEYQSLLSTALFAAFFFVVVNISEKRQFAQRAIMALMLTGGVVSLYALLQFAGVNIIPAVSSAAFNLIGSTVILGLYAAVIVVLASAFFLTETEGKLALAKRIAVGISGALALCLAIVIDFWPVWAAVIVGLLAILVYAIVKPNAIKRLTWLAIPMGVVVVATLMILVNLPLPIRAPAEVFPSYAQSFSVAKSSLFAHPIFGSGPGTFGSDFALHRSLSLNNSTLWYVQFDRGASYLTTAVATMGLAGLVAWLAVLVIGIWKSAAYLVASRKKEDASWVLALAISSAWLASAVGLVVYGASFASLFAFWLLFALLIRATSSSNIELSFQSSPRSALSLTFGFVILVVISLAGWFVTGTRLYADVAYVNGVTASASTQLDTVIGNLETAAQMNPQSSSIARNLSQAYLLKVQQVANDAKQDATARGQKIQSLSSSAVKAGQSAVNLAPEDAQNWFQLGSIYESMVGYVTNATDEAIKAFTKSAELDPTSPVHPTAVGRIYLAVAGKAATEIGATKDEAAKTAAQTKLTEALGNAETQLNKALKLKGDYAAASYQLALVKDAQGKTKEAISDLQGVELSNPTDIGVAFELAVLYYRDAQKDKAQAELERAIKLSPTFANARWLLATILEENQKWDEAIAQVQELLKNNADNETVKAKLQTLQDEKSGKIAPQTAGQPSALPESDSNAPAPAKKK